MAKRRPTKGTPTLECVIRAIAQWKRSDKEELVVILRAMLEAEEDEQAADEQTLKERT